MERGWTLLALGTLCLCALIHTSTATTTTAPGCDYIVRLGTRNTGGVFQPGVTDQLVCRAICCANPLCVAYEIQFVAVPNECWHYTTLGGFTGAATNNFYLKTVTTTTTTTATTTTTTATTTTTTPTTTTAGTGGCTDTFVSTANSGRSGGVQDTAGPNSAGTGVFTLDQCRTECLGRGRTNCAGFDFVAASGACWIHTAASITTNPIVARPNEGVDTNTRMACDAATTTPTSTPAAGSCVDTFTTTNINYNGGSRTDAAGTTAAECTAYCLNQATCTGFDLAGTVCWIHTQTAFDNPGTQTGVIHYRRQPCNATTGPTSCVDSFTEEAGMQLFSGTPRPGLDPVACRLNCLSETFCTHYEISANNQCFVHFNQSGAVPTRITNQAHRLFIRNPCQPTSTLSGVCRDTFSTRSNTNVLGGVAQAGVNTLEGCQGACLAQTTPTCTAVDYIEVGNERCFIHTAVNRVYSASRDVTHYERNFICNGTVTGPGCVEVYTPTANSNRPGGVEQTGISTNAACATACEQTTQTDTNACFGYDYNTNANQCYHFIGSLPTSVSSFPGVTSYARQFVCSRSTTLGGGCRDVYTTTANSNVFGGDGPRANIDTVEACQAACSATIEGQTGYCYGFDFDSGNNGCFFILVANYDISPGASGVTHYNRRRDCPGTVVTGVGCVELYNATANRNAAGGSDVGAQTVDSCSVLCNNNTNCQGFDFANGNCWLLLSDYTLNPGAATGVTNYRRLFNCGGSTTGGGCIPTYTMRPNIIVYGGMQTEGADSVAGCGIACNAMSACVAFNYDRVSTGQRCYLLRGSVGTENPNPDLDLYVQDNNCDGQTTPGGARCRLELAAQGNVNGGTFVPNTDTLQACQDWCIQNDPCQAVDWDATTSQCFWFTTTSTTASGDACCQHFNKICENTCIDSFNVTNGRGYFGGMQVNNRPNVMSCQAACTEREACAAFDFNTETGQCFTHTLATLDRSFTFVGVNNYRRIRCPGGTPGRTTLPTTIRTTSCPDRYIGIDNSNVQGGTRAPGPRDVVACQAFCSGDSTCTAIDWDSNQRVCWIHTGTPTVRTNLAPGVTHYQRRPCQDITPPPPVPTPGPPVSIVCNTDVHFLVDAIDRNLLDQMGLVIQQVTYALNLGNNNARIAVRSFGIRNTRLFSTADQQNFIVASVSNIRTQAGPNNLPLALQDYLNNEYRDSLNVGRQVLLVILSDLNVAPQYIGNLQPLSSQLGAIRTVLITFNNNLANNNRGLVNNFPNRLELFHQPGRSVNSANDILSFLGNPLCNSNRLITERPAVGISCLADIALVLDNSLGSSSNDWALVKAFASSLLDQLVIGSNDNRVAIVTMDNGGTRWADLDDYRTAAGLKGLISAVPSARSGISISDGMRVARQQVFTSFSGDRSNVQNVVIVLSRSRDSGDTNGAANALKQAGVAIVAIGLRSLADENLLRFVVSGDQSNYISIGSLQELPSVLVNVVQKACTARQGPVVTPAPTAAPTAAPTPAPNPSQCKADLVIVMDDSGSIRDSNKAGQPDHYDTMKTFTQNVIDRLDVGETANHIAVITYSNDATTHMYLGDYYDKPSIKRVLQDLPYTGGNTNTTGALRTARTDVMLTQRRDRRDVRNVILLITDGTTTREVNGLVAEANTIKSTGTVIIGVGITDNVNAAEMSSIITARDYYIQVANFADLSTLAQRVSELICRASR